MRRLLAKGDPRVLTLGIAGLVAAGLWALTWASMTGMKPGPGMAPMAPAVGIWLTMMAAMMLPAMTPMLAVYTGLAAREDRGGRLALRVALFGLGYFALWALVAIAMAFGQQWLAATPWFTMAGTQATPIAAGALIIAAGLWQLTPVKHTCLTHCREPLIFLMAHWRDGIRGAFPTGLHHGLYCVGCCIAIMGLMFVFGAMTLWSMAAIALWFLAEKVLPGAERWSRLAGWGLIAAGGAVLAVNLI